MVMTYSELRQKDVINICDGRRLGRPTDIVLSERACIEAIIVPAPGGIMSVFRPEKEGFPISWSCVRRIGDDVILVELEKEDV